MSRRVYHELRPVRSRLMLASVLRSAAGGLLVASLIAVGVGLWRWWAKAAIPPGAWMTLLLAGPAIGALFGLVRRGGWHTAAESIDAHYELKDRTLTALSFVDKAEPTALHELQVQDAVAHLKNVEPRLVVPMRLPKLLPYAAAAALVAAGLLSWPIAVKSVKAEPPVRLPDELVRNIASEQNLKQLDELAKSERDEKLKDLLKELRQKVEELKQAGVDEREALAKLSEMQAALNSQQAQYNTGLVDGQLQALGEAMTPAQALEGAGNALQQAQFDKAAEELEKLENPELDRKEAKAVEEKLKQVAQQAGEVGLGELSDAATELAEGVKGGGKGQIKKGTKALGKLTKAHARRRKINKLIEAELDRLSECKSQCQNNSLVKGKRPQKSTSPSQTFGLTTSGNINGDKTNLTAKRNLQQISGDPSDEGDSEIETTHSPEGRQRAARGYRDAYAKGKKQAEAVLDSEPIPLGHRQTIRRYFELIRPQNDDDSSTPAEKAQAGKGE